MVKQTLILQHLYLTILRAVDVIGLSNEILEMVKNRTFTEMSKYDKKNSPPTFKYLKILKSLCLRYHSTFTRLGRVVTYFDWLQRLESCNALITVLQRQTKNIISLLPEYL